MRGVWLHERGTGSEVGHGLMQGWTCEDANLEVGLSHASVSPLVIAEATQLLCPAYFHK